MLRLRLAGRKDTDEAKYIYSGLSPPSDLTQRGPIFACSFIGKRLFILLRTLLVKSIPVEWWSKSTAHRTLLDTVEELG